ncbi:type I secretion system permease/ATPase [Oricola sp.]|uniref:type I secretion system permease/ATPase n=1 Tax=Oricola sp. TaxID=1979950 RepID=UPI003BA9C1C3
MLPGKAKFRRAILQIGVFSLCVNVLLLTTPLFLLQVYDRVLPSSSADTLVYLSAFAVGALLLLGILEMVRMVVAGRVAAGFDVENSQRAMQAAMLSQRAGLGDIQPMRDLASVRAFIGSRSVFALFDLPFAPLFIALLWVVHPYLFWLTAAGAVAMTVIAILNQMMTAGGNRAASNLFLTESVVAQSFVRSSETLRSMGMIDNALGEWARSHVPALTATDAIARTNAIFTGISRFLRMGLQIAVLGVGAWLVLDGQMTASMIFAASLISGRGLQPMDQVIGGWRQFVEVRAAWKRFSDATGQLPRDRGYTDMPEPIGDIACEDIVYFPPQSRRGADPVIKRISFEIPAGSVVALIGSSGAGKSTLARLLVGAVDPSGGVVRIDGTDIRNWDPVRLGRHIGYLPQDVDIPPASIAKNIARFDPSASASDIIDAAERACVHSLIQTMPHGYDTLIGPGGMTLSGGQRQRIGLARAFYGTPRLIVLDEPNSNLDGEGEAALEAAIDNARATGATVVIITQRMSIIGKVDSILLLREGMIEDFGPRDAVLARHRVSADPAAGRGPADKSAIKLVRSNAGGGAAADSGTREERSPFAAFGPGMKPRSGGETA